tara:strand:- start:18729 stop:19157 length:429 start_codon:yes stop_codon:yes gene_type:complete
LSLQKLKKRIKKNEGYSNIPYKDKLGFKTIGYGHLIKKNETYFFKTKYKKSHLNYIFNQDFKKAYKKYKTLFYKKQHNQNDKELLIEMIFQLGAKGVSKFKNMLFYLNRQERYMVCLEMLDSLWYLQTPNRVDNLIKNYTEN